MSLREVDGLPGAPWERPLAGSLDRLVVESELLAGNPLGDPARRPLYVYRPPGVEPGARSAAAVRLRDPGLHRPARHVAVAHGVRADHRRAPRRDVRRRRVPRRGDRVRRRVDLAGRLAVPQLAGTGRYLDYLCDEVVPFVDSRYPTSPDRDHRGLAGKSSGGYGAMVVPMLRPDVFGALASHAGDALFECCYLPEFPSVARILRDHFDGSYEVFLERLAETPRLRLRAVRRGARRCTGTRAPTRRTPTARARRCCRSTPRPGG